MSKIVMNAYDFQYQSVWLERAKDTSYPMWQRIGFLALGTHKANGHAPLARGELARIICRRDGEPASPQQVTDALRDAKRRGWISTESNRHCLVVPPHAVKGGLPVGGEKTPCPIHHGTTRDPMIPPTRKALQDQPAESTDTLMAIAQDAQSEEPAEPEPVTESCSAAPGVARSDVNTAAPRPDVGEQPPVGENSEVEVKVSTKQCAMVGCADPTYGCADHCQPCLKEVKAQNMAARRESIYAKDRR
jgi:hypothetical protein